jgi:exodeoxyribonuclease-5
MELAKLREAGHGDTDQFLWQAMIRTREEAIKEMHRPSFVLNSEGPARDADLIVLDEVSMVGPEMAADLMSFGKPILVLGDPGQLPPIKGEGAFTQAEPDVMLTEIHRQAEDSAIIRLATMAREGKFIPYGQYSDTVIKMRKSELGPTEMLMADQVLCGMNSTRLMLNNAMRDAAGRHSVLPQGPDEKIICLRNRNDVGLINGGFLTLTDVEEGGEYGFPAEITTDIGEELGRMTIYKGHFLDHTHWDKDRAQKDHWHKKGMVEATYGNAITVHKSQGSGWENIILFDDGFGRGDDRAKWIYTALTRAESGLCILA